MTMIERVARAITPDTWVSFDAYCRRKDFSSEECAAAMERSVAVQSSLTRARAAIEAMREPVPEMYIKGGIAIYDAKPDAETAADEATACWRAMVDAAINEPQP